MRVPCGSQNADPGDRSWKKNSSWSLPMRRWSRFAASSRNFLYSFIWFVSGKEIPYRRWREALFWSPRKYDAEFCSPEMISLASVCLR